MPDDISLEKIRYCNKCQQWKPERSHHCSTCEKCIHKMDHHCPWVSNCVGAKNQKSFVLFLVYVFLVCLITLIIFAFVVYWYWQLPKRKIRTSLSLLIVSAFTGIIAMTFGLFTLVMFWDQMKIIIRNQTEVEELNRKAAQTKSVFENFQKSMGTSVLWW